MGVRGYQVRGMGRVCLYMSSLCGFLVVYFRLLMTIDHVTWRNDEWAPEYEWRVVWVAKQTGSVFSYRWLEITRGIVSHPNPSPGSEDREREMTAQLEGKHLCNVHLSRSKLAKRYGIHPMVEGVRGRYGDGYDHPSSEPMMYRTWRLSTYMASHGGDFMFTWTLQESAPPRWI